MTLLAAVRSSLYRVGHRPYHDEEPPSATSQESFAVMPISPLRSSIVGRSTPRHRHTGSKDITDTDNPFGDQSGSQSYYPTRAPRSRNNHDSTMAYTHELQYNPFGNPQAGPSSPSLTSSPKSDVFTSASAEHLGKTPSPRSPNMNTYPPPSAFGLTEENSQIPIPRPRPRFSESNPNARKSWYHSIVGNPGRTSTSRFSIYNPFGFGITAGGAGGSRQSFFHGDDGGIGASSSSSLRPVPGHFSRNASERGRLQGLMQWAQTPTKLRLGEGEGGEEMEEAGWVRG